MQKPISLLTLAERLRTLMRWRGVRSQRQLARLSGVPQTSIHRILSRGETYVPAPSTISRLARALGTTAQWLSDGDTMPPPHHAPLPSRRPPSLLSASNPLPPGQPSPNRSEEAAELHTLIGQLSDTERRHIIALVRLFAERTVRPISWRVGLRGRASRPASWRRGDVR